MTRARDTSVDNQPVDGARHPTGRAPLLRGAIAFAVALLLHLIVCLSAYAEGACPKPAGPPGPNYTGQFLNVVNFSHQDLANADFSNAHLVSPNFIGANLTGANFSSATIDNSTDVPATADFSFANLTNACFYAAKIGDSVAPVYFEYATLTCADFSLVQTNGLAVFGESLNIDKDPGGDPNKLACRTAFRSDAMDCQFIDDWRWLDLDDANIGACLSQLRGKDFSGGKFAGVNFSSGSTTETDLTGTNWQSAELSGARFNYANLENAVFTNARLMSISDRSPVRLGANFDFADLNNAVFTGADLSNTTFTWTTLTGPKVDLTGATLTGSDWEHATLSGVKLDGLTALGANFTGAALDNTTLKNTDLGYNSYKAAGTTTILQAKLEGATLCGATLDATILTCADLTGAHILNAPGPLPGEANLGGASRAAEKLLSNCKDATITTTPDGKYSTKTDGVSTGIICSTTCPDGTSGPCVSATQWQLHTPAGTQCCTGEQGTCPPRKRPGKSCTNNCDCASQHCDSGICGTNADLVKALSRSQTELRP